MSEETKEIETKKEVPMDISASESGALRGSTLNEQWRLASAYCKSGMLPKSYTTPEKVLTGMQYAYELGLKPLAALKNIAVINGQPSLWGELPLAIVRNSKLLESIDEYLIDDKYKRICLENRNLDSPLFAAVCVLKRKDMDSKEFVFTRAMAGKNGGVAAIWASYKEIMYKRKARSVGLKDLFGDVLEGLTIAEYDYSFIPEAGQSYDMNHDGTEVAPPKSNILNAMGKKTIELDNGQDSIEIEIDTPTKDNK